MQRLRTMADGCRARGLILVLVLGACADSTAPVAERSKAAPAARAIEAPADLAEADRAARSTAAALTVVEATVQLFSELGQAVGDLVPEEDNPCPGGGSASGSLGGSLNHPTVRMHFDHCVRGPYTLTGEATIRCEDFNGSRCDSGTATVGASGAPLQFADGGRLNLQQGSAYIVSEESGRRLRAELDLEGEFHTLAGQLAWRYQAEGLGLDFYRRDDGAADLRIEHVIAVGDAAMAADCNEGRFDAETVGEPLRVEAGTVGKGLLRLHSPPPRPGTQQATTQFEAGAVTVEAGDGAQTYDAAQWAGFCRVAAD